MKLVKLLTRGQPHSHTSLCIPVSDGFRGCNDLLALLRRKQACQHEGTRHKWHLMTHCLRCVFNTRVCTQMAYHHTKLPSTEGTS